VFDHVHAKVALAFEDLGERQLKNIPRPVRVYRVATGTPAETRPATAFEESIGLDFVIPDHPSIAVLPFPVMSADPEQEFFADGVAEDIITALSKISRLMVVARNSTFTYKGRAVDVRAVSREQGVRYVLEGSVRKGGNRVRVTAQLIDATTGLHLWAERYDRELSDIFAVQDDIVREIVTAMDVQLREGEQHRVWSSGTKNLEAWECVRLATDAALGGSAELRPKARKLLDRAIELDPGYAIAWAMRGWLHFTEADVGGGIAGQAHFDEAQAAAFDCGHRALELDPDCAEAYGILALTHLNAGEHDKAIEMSEKAIALAPNSAELLGGVASAVMRKSGRPDRGAELVKKAMRLSPFYRPGLLRALGNNYLALGRLEEAVACYRESLKRETGYLAPYVNLATALGQLGRTNEARAAGRDVLAQEPDFSIAGYTRGLAYRDPAITAKIADGLRRAGLPE
jgi:adenylate cyclase